MRSEMLLANRRMQPLIDHLRCVGEVGRAMAQAAGLDKKLQNDVLCAGYGHDLGKVVSWYQDWLEHGAHEDADEDKPRHHEISWAYLAQRFTLSGVVLNAIYWHHAKPLDKNGKSFLSDQTILANVDVVDDAAIAAVFERLPWPPGLLAAKPQMDETPNNVPPLFFDEPRPGCYVPSGKPDPQSNAISKINARLLAVRTCLISADWLVSSLESDEFRSLAEGRTNADQLVTAQMGQACVCEPVRPEKYDPVRFRIQQQCAMRAANEKTVVVRAPAGFGKTVIGLLWGLRKMQRVLWVCPRNAIAEAVYRNAEREVAALGLDVTMELHLSGERLDNKGNAPEFASDIVVTNIDTILSPMVVNRKAARLFTVLSSAIVFDEFHEFATEQPLFAAFVTLMRARHYLCNHVSTLLLSATPSCISTLWDCEDKITTVLPDADNHYPPAHNGAYKTSFAKDMPEPPPGSLTVFNAVKSCQIAYSEGDYDHIVHSRYTEADREQIMNAVFTEFGKDGQGIKDGRKVVSALVLQAAMDISFRHLRESICSPEFTLQRIGRCDRWGNYNPDCPTILLCDVDNGNERAAIATCYKTELRKLWRDFLEKEFDTPRSVTLEDLYSLYNRFCVEHREAIINHLASCFAEGIKLLTDYGPVKYKGFADNGKTPTTRGRNLRNPYGSYFFSVPLTGGGWLGRDDVMNEEPRALDKILERALKARDTGEIRGMGGFVKELHDAGFNRYMPFVKGRRETPPAGSQKWKKIARSMETPLPDFTREYDPELGLIERRNQA